MINEDQGVTWPGFASVVAICATVFGLLSQYIKNIFKSRRDEKADFIKSVVKEAMGISMGSLEEKISHLDIRHEKNMEKVNERIDELFREIRK